MNNQTVIVCSEINYIKALCIEITCGKCSKKIHLLDSSIQTIKENNPELNLVENPPICICLECYLKNPELTNIETSKILPISKIQIKELLDFYKNETIQTKT